MVCCIYILFWLLAIFPGICHLPFHNFLCCLLFSELDDLHPPLCFFQLLINLWTGWSTPSILCFCSVVLAIPADSPFTCHVLRSSFALACFGGTICPAFSLALPLLLCMLSDHIVLIILTLPLSTRIICYLLCDLARAFLSLSSCFFPSPCVISLSFICSSLPDLLSLCSFPWAPYSLCIFLWWSKFVLENLSNPCALHSSLRSHEHNCSLIDLVSTCLPDCGASFCPPNSEGAFVYGFITSLKLWSVCSGSHSAWKCWERRCLC